MIFKRSDWILIKFIWCVLNNYFFLYVFFKGMFESFVVLVVNKNFYDFMLYEDIGNSVLLKVK